MLNTRLCMGESLSTAACTWLLEEMASRMRAMRLPSAWNIRLRTLPAVEATSAAWLATSDATSVIGI